MLGFYKMSLIGTAHQKKEGGVCQDFSDILRVGDWVVAAIADGVGSAKHADAGSSIAVKEVLAFVSEYAPEAWDDESLIALLRVAYHTAYRKICDRAEQDAHPVSDYDTTLTCLIYDGVRTVYGHVGDGGIIMLNPYGEFSVLTTAQKGEEFNAVVPLRAGANAWTFGSAPAAAAALLMLTDGVYDMACPWLLAKQEQTVYINYVRRFMDRNVLPVETEEDFREAETKIKEFFSGKHAKQITDDKTIVGILNTDVLPEINADAYYADPDWEKLSREHRERLYGRPSQAEDTDDAQAVADTQVDPAPGNSGDAEDVPLLDAIRSKVSTIFTKKTD